MGACALLLTDKVYIAYSEHNSQWLNETKSMTLTKTKQSMNLIYTFIHTMFEPILNQLLAGHGTNIQLGVSLVWLRT